MAENRPMGQAVGIIGKEPEALILSVLFAEAKVANILAGPFEPSTDRRPTKNPLEEARRLLRIHTSSGNITLLDNPDGFPFPDIPNLVLTSHVDESQEVSLQERTIRSISKNILSGSNIVLTGLCSPGHAATIASIIERHGGLKVGSDIGLWYMPLLWAGESLRSFRETPRIIAGTGVKQVSSVEELFLRAFPAIRSTMSVRAAEAAGLFAPVYREVVGALELELANLCVEQSVDYADALDLCRGVGLDSLRAPRPFPSRDSIGSKIALSSASSGGPRLIRAARRTNEQSDRQIMTMVKSALARCDQRLRHSRIAILGLEGLGVDNAMRREPIGLLQVLKRRGAAISVYPGNGLNWVNNDSLGMQVRIERTMTGAVEKAHCALVALDRLEIGELNPHKLAAEMNRPAAICDLTGMLEASNVEKVGLLYTSIGRGKMEV